MQLLFVDEYHLMAQDIQKRGWARRGKVGAYLQTNQTRVWYSMIVTCSLQGIIATTIVEGTINSTIFVRHLKKVKREIPFRERRKSILILDNCPSHRARVTKEWFQQNRL